MMSASPMTSGTCLGHAVGDAHLVELGHELGLEGHLRRRDDDRLRVELRQRVEDRVHRPHPHVADEQVRQAVQRPALEQDRVQVGEHLGRMLPQPSPQLMIGTDDHFAASAGAPSGSAGWR
jgi:hypothetical protein